MGLLQPPRLRRTHARWRAPVALVLAVGFHVLLLGVVWLSGFVEWKLPASAKKRAALPPAFSMRPLTTDQWAKNRGEAMPAPKRAKAPEEKKAERPRGQVVDVAPGNGEEDPNAQYLSEKSNKVKKETRAKEQTAQYRNAMPQRTAPTAQPSMGQDNVLQPQISGNMGEGDDTTPKSKSDAPKRSLEIPTLKPQAEVAVRQTPGKGPGAGVENRPEQVGIEGNSQRLKIQPGGAQEEASAGKAGQPGIANLLPSAAVVDKILGAAPNDHLRQVAEGEGTYLNTREWKYASFFNRVKQGVSLHWNPTEPLRVRDPTGNIYGSKDRYTLLSVTLGQDGRVRDIYVEKSSGVDFLDAEAIRSFERAQPFPNPPPGLLADDSQVKFSFGFFLEMGSPRMRLYRWAN